MEKNVQIIVTILLVLCISRSDVFKLGEDTDGVTLPQDLQKFQHKLQHLPGISDCCDPLDQYVYGGTPIKVNEFPSLALLHYINSSGRSGFPCAGTLISKRYVLTAAHCLTGEVLHKFGKLVAIRLGEHDWSTTRCANGKCTDGVLEFKVDEKSIIIPKMFVNASTGYDIALIRLSKPVEPFTANIQPMCLRWVQSRIKVPPVAPNQNFTVVGWGRTLNESQSRVPRKVEVPFYYHTKCAKILRGNITSKQICAGGEFKKDSCRGDSGGPLITTVANCKLLDGIVSFGKKCGLELPAVYTNVTSYRKWILENIEP